MVRFLAGDEEMGKKDDDYRSGGRTPIPATWSGRKAPMRRNVKRVAWGFIAALFLYLFFYNMPTDVQQRGVRPQYIHPEMGESRNNPISKPSSSLSKSTDEMPPGAEEDETSKHTFSGPIKFFELAATLQAISRSQGVKVDNKNILFAASSLKSASTLIPMACDMAAWERSIVHFVYMGRSEVSMELMKAVNGINDECAVNFHDGRPDFGPISTDFRMEVSTSAGLSHINSYMHPQAIIVDGSKIEDDFFLRAVRQKAATLSKTVIELPENSEQTLQWVTRLDAASLSAWDKVDIDILVHAPPASSGSIMRLLDSLKKADIFGSKPPRLIIELPPKIDEPSKRYLETFKWPPAKSAGGLQTNYLTLRHRIPQGGITPEQSALRTLESFWPANAENSHVLLLSSQAELSPLFYHYLKYTILEYRYSEDSKNFQGNLMGISLDLPSNYLNDSTTFTPPITISTKGNPNPETPFLWQAPNSNAALYFGDKWTELHTFLSNSLTYAQPTNPLTTKQVSKTYPSWLESILQLARIRGYWMLYPAFPSTEEALVTLHNELYQPPEEFLQDEEEFSPDADELTADPKTHLSLNHKEHPLLNTHLLSILPNQGALPTYADMPVLTFDGRGTTSLELSGEAAEFKRIFTKEIGGCSPSLEAKPLIAGSAADLFCDGNEPLTVAATQAAEKDSPPVAAGTVTDSITNKEGASGVDEPLSVPEKGSEVVGTKGSVVEAEKGPVIKGSAV